MRRGLLFIFAALQPHRRVVQQNRQGIKLAGMFELQTLQYVIQRRQMRFCLVKLAQVDIGQRQRAHRLLQPLTERTEYFDSRSRRLRPHIAPLPGDQRDQYRQPFIHAV